MPNMRQIAKQAEVSVATVSRVLRADASFKVQDDTKRRILQIAHEQGYDMSRIERSTARRPKNADVIKLGLLIAYPETLQTNRPYYESVRHGIESECGRVNARLQQILRISSMTEAIDFEEGPQGYLILGHRSYVDDISAHSNVPAVFLSDSPDPWRYDSIQADHETAVETGLNHLIELGHSRIAFVGIGANSGKQSDQRLQTFRKIMQERKLYQRSLEFMTPNGLPSEGQAVVRQMAASDRWPTAMFIATDPIALGILAALHEYSIAVPSKMSLVSFGDAEYSKYLNPPLTTVRAVTEEMGRMAVHLLIHRIRNGGIPVQIKSPVELILRSSTSGPSEV